MTGWRHRWNCSPTTSEAMPTAGTRWVCASMPWDELIARHRHTAARRSRGGAYSHTVHRAPSRRALVCSVPTLPSSARRSAATTDTTRGAIHDGAGGGGVMKRAWYVCHRLWMRWRSVPVARPCQPPPSRDVGWSALTPTFLQSPRSASAGETAVGNCRASPLCGFQDLPAPRRSQACACGDTTLGVWRHASLERRTLMRLKRWALLGVLQRASVS
jgi:hypothetical protein